MEAKTMNLGSAVLVPLLLGLLVAWIAASTLAGRQIPLISGPKVAVVAVLILGMVMCTAGIGQVGSSGRWTSPLAILGILLGVLILVVAVSALAGWQLPWIASTAQSVMFMAVLIALKFVIGSLGYFYRLL